MLAQRLNRVSGRHGDIQLSNNMSNPRKHKTFEPISKRIEQAFKNSYN
jgi:hypothetical protein